MIGPVSAPTGDGRWLQSLTPLGAESREPERQPRVFNYSGMTPAAAARAYNRVLGQRELESQTVDADNSTARFVNDKGPSQPGVNTEWTPPPTTKPPEQPGVSMGWTPPADTKPQEQSVGTTSPSTQPETPSTSSPPPNTVPTQNNSKPTGQPGPEAAGQQPEFPPSSNLSVLTELGLPLAADAPRSTSPPELIEGPYNPVLTTMWLPEGSAVEQKQTTIDSLPALQTDVSTPGLPGTTTTKPLGRSATITAALTAWPDHTPTSKGNPTGYPTGTGILASGPSEQNQALLKNPVPGSAGALVTGGAAAAATTGAVLTGALAFTETGILVTAGTMAAVVTWPAVLAVVAGVGLVAGAAWVLSIDPPEGEEPSTGARPGAVPQPPPAPRPIDPEIPGPLIAPADPQIPLLADPDPLSSPPITAPAPIETPTPWEPQQRPALDPFDHGSDGVEDPTAVPDPSQLSLEPPEREHTGPVAPTPPYAADETVNAEPADTTADADAGTSDSGGAGREAPVRGADAGSSNDQSAPVQSTLVDTLVQVRVDPVRPEPRFDPTPYIRAALALATEDELFAVQELIERWGEDAQMLLAQYGLKGSKKTPEFAGIDNVADKLHESLSNLDEVRYRGYPYLFESKQQFEELKKDVLELARRYGVNPEDVKFKIQGGSVHNPSTGDVDIALVVDPETFKKYARQFLDASMLGKIRKAIIKDEQKGKFAHYRWAPRQDLERPVGEILHDTLPDDYKIQVSLVEEGGPFDFGPYL
ncbi:hypothetical protein [Nocardia fluminea]|uniref:hypothetical protein n=1 Tax=Nocardia fluminea TaxID=134984 RepID=UPI003D11BBA8